MSWRNYRQLIPVFDLDIIRHLGSDVPAPAERLTDDFHTGLSGGQPDAPAVVAVAVYRSGPGRRQGQPAGSQPLRAGRGHPSGVAGPSEGPSGGITAGERSARRVYHGGDTRVVTPAGGNQQPASVGPVPSDLVPQTAIWPPGPGLSAEQGEQDHK